MSRTEPKPVRPSVVPPLQPGDHLTRAEFERRYDATPNLKKAELIEGIVYMPPPVSHVEHSGPHVLLVTLIGNYMASTPNTIAGDNGSCRLDLDNMPQPDVYLLLAPEGGGQAKIDDDGYVAGAPEFVGEVAASSVSYDLHVKLNVYRRNGVREYLVWRTQDAQFDFFRLRDGEFERVAPDEAGVVRSTIFPGLWISTNALTRGDLAAANGVLREGLASPEHAAFIERLRQ
jgi:hypothetical protein